MTFSKVRCSAILAGLLCLTMFTACGGSETSSNYYAEDPAPYAEDPAPTAVSSSEAEAPADDAPATEKAVRPAPDTPVSQTKDDGTSDIHVTIESVEISLNDLKAQNYTVPVYVTLEENSGISYSEWGASFDERCSVVTNPDDEEVRFDTVCSINTEKHFFWTAWSAASIREKPGKLLSLLVTLPEDAAPGDVYAITYAPVSQANMLHSWANSETDWVKSGYVSWTDGGITVTE